MAMIRNLVVLISAISVYYSYLIFISDAIPIDTRLVVNFLLVPFGIGTLSAVAMSARLSACALLAALIPILPIVLYGGDSAKPGMEIMVIPPLAGMFALGSTIGVIAKTYIGKWWHRPERS